MYTAIFSRTYPATNVTRVFADIAADGFDGVQANLSSAGFASLPESLPHGMGEQFYSAARTSGLRLAALSGTYNMAHPDVGVRHAARVGFRNVVQAARDMGAPVVSLCTGSRNAEDMWKAHPGNRSEAAWNDLCAELEFALPLAHDAGVRLAIEPEPANIIHDAKAARQLLNELASPSLGIILDAANLLSPESLPSQQRILDEAVDLLAGFLLLAHAKDIDGAGQVVAPGEGAVDLLAFTRALRRAGYDGALIAHGFSVAKTSVAAQVLRRLMSES